jgi:SSS family solute:Na+ symporter
VTPPVVVVFLFGILWPRANAKGALAALVGGVSLGGLGWLGNEILGLTSLHYLYAAGLMFAASAAVLVGVSLATAAPEAERTAPLVWRRSTEGERRGPWYRSHAALSAGLLVLCAVVVIYWW